MVGILSLAFFYDSFHHQYGQAQIADLGKQAMESCLIGYRTYEKTFAVSVLINGQPVEPLFPSGVEAAVQLDLVNRRSIILAAICHIAPPSAHSWR